jgi:hypothetical protein
MKQVFDKLHLKYSLPVVSFVVTAGLAVWLRYLYLCCGISIGWSYLFLVIGTVCAGWLGAVYVLNKQNIQKSR